MKTVVVLNTQNPLLQNQAGEINRILNDLTGAITSVELWLFYQERKPELIPKISPPPSHLKLISLNKQHSFESYLQILALLSHQNSIDLMVFTSDSLGAELATRISFRLKGSACLQVESCKKNLEKLEVLKPVYGNNLTGKFSLDHPPYCLSVAKFPAHSPEMTPVNDLNTELVTMDQMDCDWIEEFEIIPDATVSGLIESDFVLVVGQGAKTKETVSELHQLANRLGAEFGASRPVVMNAWTDMNRIIGVSGLIISPRLSIIAGVSGSSVFKVGIENSDFIIAINTDRKAPIFQIADVGVISDMKVVLTELEKVILNDKKESNSQIGSEG